MENIRLTVFTPAYNRAHCMVRLYESLKRQTCHDFIWMIIDDGSTDHLEELVRSWIRQEQQFSILYYRKENGGMYTAYNLALSHLTTDYWVCIDSDDRMPSHAVEKIYRYFSVCEAAGAAGIVGLDADTHGRILGGYFPTFSGGTVHLLDLKLKVQHRGDMKMIYRTSFSRPFTPMPEIPGEKDFNPYYMMLQIDETAQLYAVNEVFCIADYQPDGMSRNVWQAYRRSPISYGMLRLEFLRRKHLPFTFALRECTHYVSSWLFAQTDPGKKDSLPAPLQSPLMIAAWLPGLMLHLLIRVRTRKG